jgi:hypothetical protein
MLQTRIVGTLIALAAVSLVTGCGAVQQARQAAKQQQTGNFLKMLGIAYHQCHDTTGKGPADWAEAEKYDLPAEAKQVLESEGYTVVWGLKMSEAKQGTSNTIIAYQPKAKTEGGMVLLLDGSAQQMSAADVSEKLAAAAP